MKQIDLGISKILNDIDGSDCDKFNMDALLPLMRIKEHLGGTSPLTFSTFSQTLKQMYDMRDLVYKTNPFLKMIPKK